ncbi:hypothetical protein RMN57_18375 [Kitasatospora sp. CM 4170]|uniref:Uncharacterized protein n=1 Tax=Kitasatospora aburaviensis TaxID=67265 RepID=A0ABW1F4Y7_9ACTN|nr:hypothetical protein [Kitasatospora sp. CM 4170]WNM46530.1 hypothetical protein RMN57_18375 [Kitasatospora sp. CM 4170]
MAKSMPSSTNKLRRGTQDLLERRGMATSPRPLPPRLRSDGPSSAGASSGGSAFRHGGRDVEVAAMHSAPAMHAELKGHRHRGAEKHSAH